MSLTFSKILKKLYRKYFLLIITKKNFKKKKRQMNIDNIEFCEKEV